LLDHRPGAGENDLTEGRLTPRLVCAAVIDHELSEFAAASKTNG
jgi:hypothetical protein